MKRVTGLGGVFFKSNDPKMIREWYKNHLGLDMKDWGCTFKWREYANKEKSGTTAFSPFKNDSAYFAPSEKQFMFNFRVDDLKGLLEELKKEGVTVIDNIEESEYGKFGWIMDPEGNKIELWEPNDEPIINEG